MVLWYIMKYAAIDGRRDRRGPRALHFGCFIVQRNL